MFISGASAIIKPFFLGSRKHDKLILLQENFGLRSPLKRKADASLGDLSVADLDTVDCVSVSKHFFPQVFPEEDIWRHAGNFWMLTGNPQSLPFLYYIQNFVSVVITFYVFCIVLLAFLQNYENELKLMFCFWKHAGFTHCALIERLGYYELFFSK